MVKRVLMYARGNGLGHLRRTRNIAQAILERDPKCSILVLADNRVTPFFEPIPGLDHVKIPSRSSRQTKDSSKAYLDIAASQMSRLRENLILQAFKGFDPDVVLVDHRPVGQEGELKPLLDYASQRTHRARLYLGLRDMDQTPEEMQRSWTRDGVYDYLPVYDGVLVYGSSEIFNAESAYGLSSHVSQVTHCNYVVPPAEDLGPTYPAEDPFILVLGGAGRDSMAMSMAFVRALPMIHRVMPLPSVVITGPGMSPADRQKIGDGATMAQYPVQVLSSVKDAVDLTRRAEVIVTMAGYNSMAEILRCRKKALVIPREVGAFDQQHRTQLFARLGLVRATPLDSLTPNILAEELIKLYQSDNIPNPANLPRFDGAQRAAAVLLGEE